MGTIREEVMPDYFVKSTGKTYTIPDDKVATFKSTFPDAQDLDALQQSNMRSGMDASHNYDVEDIRQRNLQEQKNLGNIQEPTSYKKLSEIFSAPGNSFNEGLSMIADGDIHGGLGGVIAGMMELPGSVFGLAQEGYNNLPGGKTAGDIVALPGQVGEKAIYEPAKNIGYAIGNFLDKFGVNADVQQKILPILMQGIAAQDPEKFKKTTEMWDKVGRIASQYEGFMGAAALPKGIVASTGAETFSDMMARSGVKHATKLGAIRKAGEGVPEMRRAGQFAAEFDITRPGKTEVIAKGKYDMPDIISKSQTETGRIIKKLSGQMRDRIIEPATKAGELIDGKSILDAYRGMRDEYLNMMTPKSEAVNMINDMIDATEKSLNRSGNPGFLTPDEAQQLKLKNNNYLEKFYTSAEGAGKPLSMSEKTEQQVLSSGNSALRRQIEAIDPQISRINWTEGAALDLQEAARKYVQDKYRRNSSSFNRAAVSVGSKFAPHFFTIAEFMSFKPFRDAYHKFMTNQMKRLSGEPSEFIKDVKPYKAPSEAPPGTSLTVPPQNVSPSSGSSPTGSPPSTPDASTFTDVPNKPTAPKTKKLSEMTDAEAEAYLKSQIEKGQSNAKAAGLPVTGTPSAYEYGAKLDLAEAKEMWNKYKENREKLSPDANQLRKEILDGYVSKQKKKPANSLSKAEIEAFLKHQK